MDTKTQKLVQEAANTSFGVTSRNAMERTRMRTAIPQSVHLEPLEQPEAPSA